MKITDCPIEGGNFGDTLNTMAWDRLFPDLTRLKEDMLVYGIGTLLDGRHKPRHSRYDVVAQLQGCSRVVAESPHGAICADAMTIRLARL